ncbi:MAG TPA: thermonuclease family protein [Pseudolabrys sp.]|nr:thermonuclease family protein [Pseudolabrys sp.]
MSTVTQFGRRRRRVPRFAALVVFALMLGGLALFQAWQSRAVVAPPTALLAVQAVDGDTLRADSQRIRLSGIDAPELAQTCRDARGQKWSCGAASRQHLAALVARGVTCTRNGEDRYGRMLATCSAPGVTDIGEAMVRDGHALNYDRYTSDYASAEREARAARRGLWQGEFDNPEDWRHARKR